MADALAAVPPEQLDGPESINGHLRRPGLGR
ncbi:DUF6631 family protein [Pseudomonas aeruginosa]